MESTKSPTHHLEEEENVDFDKLHAAVGQQKVVLLNYLVAVFSAIGTFLFGYDSGIIGNVIVFSRFKSYFHEPSKKLTGAVVSVFAGGAFFGSLCAGYLADKIGRKRTIQLGSLIAAFGAALQTGSNSMAMMLAGRTIAGFAIGMLSMIVPLYQAEISPPHARGLLSGWTQMMISWGFFAANWIGYGCQFLNTDAQWRVPLAIQIVPAIILGVGMFWLPYSPRWLAQRDRHEEALSALLLLHGKGVDPAVVKAEYNEIVSTMEWERENVSSKFSDLWATRAALHRTAAGFLVQVGGQFTGVNVNTYFGPTIYEQLGFSGTRVLLINGISGALGVVQVFVFITFVADRIGRRKPLIFGALGMALAFSWQTGCASMFAPGKTGTTGGGIAAVTAMFVFSCIFSFSYGPISWIYQSEVFSMPLRAMGASFSTCGNWGANVLLSSISPIALEAVSWRYFLVFIFTNLANAVIAYFLYKETKGLTLEELGAVFGDTEVIAPPAALRASAAQQARFEDEKKKDHALTLPKTQHVETV